MCSGKVFYDLEAGRADANDNRTAIVRLEQFYPFPKAKLQEVFASYEGATEIFWTQEEPQNMGGWTFVESRIREITPENISLKYVGRAASGSPARFYAIHEPNKTDWRTIGNQKIGRNFARGAEVSEKSRRRRKPKGNQINELCKVNKIYQRFRGELQPAIARNMRWMAANL